MIKFENTEVMGWEAAVRGMRNPMNSWDKIDSHYCCSRYCIDTNFEKCDECPGAESGFLIGTNDLSLMKKLAKAGGDHRKFMRMITVYVDITAPLYWWKEFDTYKIATVANSCSTMHKIAEKEFEMSDFSVEHLCLTDKESLFNIKYTDFTNDRGIFSIIVSALNVARNRYLETKDKKYWWQMIQLLPSSYNQKRTICMNYEVLANIYKSRKNHKLDEWSVGFMDWIRELPYSELITGGEK